MNGPLKVLHICADLDPRSGGPVRAITGLCRALARVGVETTLFVNSPQHEFANAGGVCFLKGSGGSLVSVWQDMQWLLDEIKPEVIHLHGLWMPSNHVAFNAARRRNIPVILSTRGMLDPWALRQKPVKKKLAMLLYQRRDLRAASCFHATAEREVLNIRAQRIVQPIAEVPNGVDVPEVMPTRHPRSDGRKTALFLSRLHPGKGLMELVAAWGQVRPKGWIMQIVGPDVCGHQAAVETEIRRLGLQSCFEFVGLLDDAKKWQAYVDADLFVHPSHSENFGISIAEALASGLPVITTKGAPWAQLLGSGDSELNVVSRGSAKDVAVKGVKQTRKTNALSQRNPLEPAIGRCGWWVDIGAEPLSEALKEAMDMTDDERRTMGGNGRRLVERRYVWPAIGTQMKRVYQWMLYGGAPPETLWLGNRGYDQS